MRACLSSLLIGAIWASLVTGAAAQTSAEGPTADVVVTGKRDHQDAAHRFVNEITVKTNEQVAQFSERVCPLVLGLPAPYNAAIKARFLKDAHDAGARVDGPGCVPNVVVMIADDGQGLVEKLHTARPAMFEGLDPHALQTLLRNPGPVRAWQGLEFLDNGGLPVGIPPAAALERAGGLSLDSYVTAHNFTPSRLQQAFRERIDSAFIVIDAKAVDGLTITQIADYAAMRALAMTRDPKGSSLGQVSILGLFDDARVGSRPPSLSVADAAYLHALYTTSNVVAGASQRSNIALSVKQALSEAAPARADK